VQHNASGGLGGRLLRPGSYSGDREYQRNRAAVRPEAAVSRRAWPSGEERRFLGRIGREVRTFLDRGSERRLREAGIPRGFAPCRPVRLGPRLGPTGRRR
jgi:hypothetical protein